MSLQVRSNKTTKEDDFPEGAKALSSVGSPLTDRDLSLATSADKKDESTQIAIRQTTEQVHKKGKSFFSTTQTDLSSRKDPLLSQFLALSEIPEAQAEEIDDLSSHSLLDGVSLQPNPNMNPALFNCIFSSPHRLPLQAFFRFFSDLLPKPIQEAFEKALSTKERVSCGVREKDPQSLRQLAQELSSSLQTRKPDQPLLLLSTISKTSLSSSWISACLNQSFPELNGAFTNLHSAEELTKTLETKLWEKLQEQPEWVQCKEAKELIEGAVHKVCEKINSIIPASAPEGWIHAIKGSLKKDLEELFVGTPSEKGAPPTLRETLWSHLTEGKLEEMVHETCATVFHQAHRAIEKTIETVSDAIPYCLPSQGKELLAFSGLMNEENHLWLQFEKQANGKYQLTIFSKETDYHSQEGYFGKGKTSLPLIYANIEPEKLSEEFFYSLFSYEALPFWDSSIDYSIEGFFANLIGSLGHSPEPPSERTLVSSSQYPADDPYSLGMLFLQYHSQFPKEQFSRLSFDMHLKAFLEMWSHIKGKEYQLSEDSSLRASLKKAADILSSEVKDLYRNQMVSLDELRNVASTLIHFDKICCEQELKSQRSALPSSLFPPQVQTFARTFLNSFGLSPSTLSLLKEAFIQIFGKEVEEPLDLALQALLPTLEDPATTQNPNETHFFSFDLIAQELKTLSSMRFSLLHLFRFFARYSHYLTEIVSAIVSFRLFSILLSTFPLLASLGASTLSLLFVLFRSNKIHGLERILPKVYIPTIQQLQRVYHETFGSVKHLILSMILKGTLSNLLSGEEREKIHTLLVDLQQKITRDGTISYDLPISAGYVTDTVALQAEPSVPISLAESPASSPSSQKALPVNTLHFIIPTSATIHECLDQCNKTFLIEVFKGNSLKALDYLKQQIRLLPIPGTQKGNKFWDSVQDKEFALEGIHALLLHINNHIKANKSPELLISFFTLFAITDCLARKCPNGNIPDAKPNGCDILLWAQNPQTQIRNPAAYVQLRDVCNYFGFDIRRRYAFPEIQQRRRESIFFSGFTEELSRSSILVPLQHYKINISSLSAFHSDQQFYSQLLQDPIVKKKMDALFPSPQFSDFERLYALVSDPPLASLLRDENKEAYGLTSTDPSLIQQTLTQNSHQKDPRKGLLPRPFSILRLSYLTLHTALTDGAYTQTTAPRWGLVLKPEHVRFDSGIEIIDSAVNAGIKKTHEITSETLRIQTFSSNLSLDGFSPSEKDFSSEYQEGLNRVLHSFEMTELHSVTALTSKTQQEILQTTPQGTSPQETQLLQMITSHKVDQFIRALAFFQENYQQTLSQSHYRSLFELLVFQIGALESQIQENPAAVGQSLSLFFREALDYTLANHDIHSCLFLIEHGLRLQSFCKALSPIEITQQFPDFLSVLKEKILPQLLLSRSSSQVLLEKALLLLSAVHLDGKTPEQLSPAEEEDAIINLCRYHYSLLALPQNNCTQLKETFSTLFRLFESQIQKALQDPRKRAKIIETLLKDGEIPLSTSYTGQWQGTFPAYCCGPHSFTFHSHRAAPSVTLLRQISSRFPDPGPCSALSDTTYYFPKHHLTVESLPNGETKITMVYQEKTFQLVNDESDPAKKSPSKSKTYWIEESSSSLPILQMICMKEGQVQWIRPAQREENEEKVSYKILWKEKAFRGKTLREIDASKETRLGLLSWFLPPKHLRAYVDPQEPQKIARLEFTQVQTSSGEKKLLAFSVEKIEGEAVALSEGSFPGFYIANKQKQPHLTSYPNYLLLENARQEQQLLLVAQPLSALVINFLLSHFAHLTTSPFVESVVQSLLTAENQAKPEATYYAYSVDAEGNLNSEDPTAITYLFLHYFTHDEVNKAKKYLQKLEDLGRTASFPSETFQIFDSLVLPLFLSQETWSTEFSLRIAAIRIENHLIHGNTTKLNPSPEEPSLEEAAVSPLNQPPQFLLEHLEYFLIQAKYDQYLHEVSMGKSSYLTKFQELFLLKNIERKNKRFLNLFLPAINGTFRKWINTMGLTSFANRLLFLPSLKKRKKELEEEQPNSGIKPPTPSTPKLKPVDEKKAEEKSPQQEHSLLSKTTKTFLQLLQNPFRSSWDISEATVTQFIQSTNAVPIKLEELPVDLWDLTLPNIERYFPSYYRLAHNAPSSLWNDNKALFQAKRAKLQENLRLLKGKYNSFSGHLLLILQQISEGSYLTSFPDPSQLEHQIAVIPLVDQLQEKSKQLTHTLDCIQGNTIDPLDPDFLEYQKELEPLLRTEKKATLECSKIEKERSSGKITPEKDRSLTYHMAELRDIPLQKKLLTIEWEGDLQRQLEEIEKEILSLQTKAGNPKQRPLLSCRDFLLRAWKQCRKAEASHLLLQKSHIKTLTSQAISGTISGVKISRALAGGTLGLGWRVPKSILGMIFSTQVFPSSRPLLPAPTSAKVDLPSLPAEVSESLTQREQKIDKALDTLLAKYFHVATKEITPKDPDDQPSDIDLFDPAQESDLPAQKAMERLQQSIQDYQKRERAPERIIQLKEDEKTVRGKLEEDLRALHQEVQQRLSKEQEDILALTSFTEHERELSDETRLLNQLSRRQHKREPISFEDLFLPFIRGEEEQLVQRGILPERSLSVFKEKMFLHLVLLSRFQFLFQQIEQLKDTAEGKPLIPIADTLLQRRVYGFSTTSEKLLKTKLLFETSKKVLLRSKAMQQLDRIATGGAERSVAEVIMGIGKSFFMIPSISHLKADGQRLVINIWPSPVARSNIESTRNTVRQAFDQIANGFQFTRVLSLSISKLWSLLLLFQRSILQREQINTTKEDLQALELRCLELGLDVDGTVKLDRNWKEKFELLRQSVAQIRQSGQANIDEVHKLFDPRKNELNFPVGKKKHIKESYRQLMSDILLLLVSIPEVNDLLQIKSEHPQSIKKAEFKEKIAPLLLQKICDFSYLSITPEQKDQFIRYVLGEEKTIPSFVLQSRVKGELGLVKGLITVLLPMILEEVIHVHFTSSKQGKLEYARPSEGNENPVESANIRNPFEAFVKTSLLKLKERLSDAQLRKYTDMLKRKANRYSAITGKPLYNNPFALLFERSCGYKLHAFQELDWPEIASQLRQSDTFVMAYTRDIIGQQIDFFPFNLTSNAYNFSSMFPFFDSYTGSPDNDECFPQGTQFFLDPGTMGESAAILLEKYRKNPCSVQILDGESPRALLHELLQKFFPSQSKARALIDRGHLFTGMSNEQVAREILAYLSANRPDMEGVVFYDAKKQLVLLKKGADQALPVEESKIPEDRRITYFDESHTYASDIAQSPEAEGYISISEDTTVEEFFQALWRLRKLTKERGGDQQPIFAMTKKVKERIARDHLPTMDEIIKFCNRNESHLLAELNYQGTRQELPNVIRRAILDKILFAPSADRALAVLDEFRQFLQQKVEEDPFEMYGHIDTMASPEEVLQNLRISLYNIIASSSTFTKQEKTKIQEDLRKIGQKKTFPQKVHAYQVGNQLDSSRLDDLGRETQVTQTQQQEQESDEEVESELFQELEQTQLNRTLSAPKETPPPFCPWPEELHLTNYSQWFQTTPVPLPEKANSSLVSYLGSLITPWTSAATQLNPLATNSSSSPPIFALSDVFQHWTETDLRDALTPTLSPSLFATNNFIQLIDSYGGGKKIKPFGRHQKPVFEVLVLETNRGGKKDKKILLIDQEEALYFRKQIERNRAIPSSDKSVTVGLFDVKTQAVVATTSPELSSAGLLKDQEFLKAMAQLCFLDGQVTYSENYKKALVRWLKETRQKPQNLEAIFRSLSSQRIMDYDGSDIDALFFDLKTPAVPVQPLKV